MSELPTGTVTFLFTDIEGSTKLLHELGDAYADALAEHRRVLREAFARHGGVEVDTQGDAFFVAFVRVKDALAAAAEADRRSTAVRCAFEWDCTRVSLWRSTRERSGEPSNGKQSADASGSGRTNGTSTPVTSSPLRDRSSSAGGQTGGRCRSTKLSNMRSP
jgi:hypothetical protein